MISLEFLFPLMSTPRERIARNGGRYKSQEYRLYQARLNRAIKEQLARASGMITGSYYVGFYNGYVLKTKTGYDASDIDNIIKGILDALVLQGKLRRDSRSSWQGTKILSYPESTDRNYVLLGTMQEEELIDKMIRDARNFAKINELTR